MSNKNDRNATSDDMMSLTAGFFHARVKVIFRVNLGNSCAWKNQP